MTEKADKLMLWEITDSRRKAREPTWDQPRSLCLGGSCVA